MNDEQRPEMMHAYNRLQSLRSNIGRLSDPELAQLERHAEMLVTILDNLNLAEWLRFDVGSLAQITRTEVERRTSKEAADRWLHEHTSEG